jgi:hypothetical protein
MSCLLVIPANTLTAQGLATPSHLTGRVVATSGGEGRDHNLTVHYSR